VRLYVEGGYGGSAAPSGIFVVVVRVTCDSCHSFESRTCAQASLGYFRFRQSPGLPSSIFMGVNRCELCVKEVRVDWQEV